MQCYGENIAFDDKNGSNEKMINEDLCIVMMIYSVLFTSCYVNYFLAMFWQKVFIYPKH